MSASAAPKFDPKQPFGEVWGQPGISFVQNGNSFNARGEIVDPATLKPVDEELPEKEPEEDGFMTKCYTPEDNKQEAKKENVENLHWQKLKAMLAIYGEEYVNREQAVSFLKGKKS